MLLYLSMEHFAVIHIYNMIQSECMALYICRGVQQHHILQIHVQRNYKDIEMSWAMPSSKHDSLHEGIQ